MPTLYCGKRTLERKCGKTHGKIEFSKSQWLELIQSIQHVRIEVLVMGQVSF